MYVPPEISSFSHLWSPLWLQARWYLHLLLPHQRGMMCTNNTGCVKRVIKLVEEYVERMVVEAINLLKKQLQN